jgi:hypothetical protein
MGKRVAILFFGLTRSLRNNYNNLKEKLFDQLTKNNYEYDTFIHTYMLENPYINPWSGEKVENYDNTAYTILKPRHFIVERQSIIEPRLVIPRFYSKLGNWAGCASTPQMYKYLVRNMVLALYSKRRVVNLFAKYKHEYDYVIICRPDQQLETEFNASAFKRLGNKNIIIPFEHSYYGFNDRFCVAKPNAAIQYGNALKYLYFYSKLKPIVSEVYMRWYLQAIGLKIVFSPLKSKLIRC